MAGDTISVRMVELGGNGAVDARSEIHRRHSYFREGEVTLTLYAGFWITVRGGSHSSLIPMFGAPAVVASPCGAPRANSPQLSLKGCFAGDTAKAHAKTSMIAGEGVSNIRTVAAFNAQSKILSVFCHELRVPQKKKLSNLRFPLWSLPACSLRLAPEIIRGGEAVGSVFPVLDRHTGIEPDDPDAHLVETIRGDIEFRHVGFAYPSRPDVMVLRDFNLRIRAGHSQALVGASGSGKCSVIARIERFYDPLSGKVMIDGKEIRRLNLKSLRLKIGLVQQEPALFAATIFHIIAYVKGNATEAEVMWAARAANAHGFIIGLPEGSGYKTLVGERGVQLSGGQKQRIAVARAVLKNPTVLLFDEATSALDAESECVLQEALERLMREAGPLL
ncbi:hypothetical protein HID58_049296 [Brassica napus]|uniref:ABC transporter domain-containing protein n=1 Tax=Brassica napus TaxID=3708 RepID=A0ABQ8B4V9_BRANA|nr:hypothetical protein HID58_049296 [Brassica napus]